MLCAIANDSEVALARRKRPAPAPGEALVRVLLAGICNTDLEILKGYMSFSGILGHEFVGVVEAAPGHPEMVGKRVVADINIAPGPGDHRHTPERMTLGIHGKDGAFAEHLTVPVANCVLVPGELSDERAVFAEPLAAAIEVGQQVHITAAHKVCVLGDGKLGLLTAMSLRHLCPELVLVGRHTDKLAIAHRYGVRTALQGSARGPFDIVVEATGRPHGVEAALNLVRPEGTVVLKSTLEAPAPIDLTRIVVNEITLVGSRCGSPALAIDHMQRGLVDPTGLIEAVYPLERVWEAFERASRPGARKILLRVSQ
ncbi:MDR/zinc-dependent alcohol dehydrogenase-like family protein [Fundidesulfovibrio agrisoli]|uniref:MDR/zinc-dependent alcohol dehydrogenase-like family protein n=1 Tax=Fundidesulfovibrio agrisoli TaxID=2922717 RepID=UPI001FABE97A|nr:alcohol dehydrogenase catalytic domain-containing protein [Fundidesulfovibrio agrisoli]